MRRLAVLTMAAALVATGTAQAHVIKKHDNLAHAKYVCAKGTGKVKWWHCQAVRWIAREIRERYVHSTDYWINRQITVATLIARSATLDPWPNCPDPYFNPGSSWQDTVNCENGGNWYDSPGFYRCGLQFHPNWEEKYGRLCP